MSGKRASLSLMKKYEIIKEVDKQKTPKAEIAQQHGIPKGYSFHYPEDERRDNKCSTEGRPQCAAEKFATHDSCRFRRSFARVVQPDRTLAMKEDVCKGTKRSKEHLTVLCCNMDGSDKMKPLVICKLKKSRGFRRKILPYDSDFNKKAWMISAVFTRWLCGFDMKIGAVNRKVVLFIDNCPAHPNLDNLRNVELVFLQKNTTSMLQPLDQGIIQQVNLKFWEMLVESMVLKMEIGKDMKKWDVFRAMEAIVASWRVVQHETIANWFRHAHFVTPVNEEAAIHVFLAAASSEDPADPPPVDAQPQPGPSTVPLSARLTVTRPCDEETWQQLAPDCMFEEFVTADNNIAVWGTLDYTNDVQGQTESSGEEDGEGEAEEPTQVPKTRDILKAGDVYAAVLRRHGANEEMWSHFKHLREFVEQTLVKKKQTTIM
ncbi:hypothetical protein PR048_001718 [Dryococelus australis]|uniref:DDE-1 domain-containing protein n=1 Tax=Dryococelus australis TaxID=614101 RepID=A0ABQ9II29_9NEOP|nr:hypothetical protein PR048_001718 [Dryococelus australis]